MIIKSIKVLLKFPVNLHCLPRSIRKPINDNLGLNVCRDFNVFEVVFDISLSQTEGDKI